jgi:hypothetical protein
MERVLLRASLTKHQQNVVWREERKLTNDAKEVQAKSDASNLSPRGTGNPEAESSKE